MGTGTKQWLDVAMDNLERAKKTESNRDRRNKKSGGRSGEPCSIYLPRKKKSVRGQNQSEASANFLDYLIRTQSLLDAINLPWIPNHGGRAILNIEPRHPEDGLDETEWKRVSEGVYIYTKLCSEDKQRYIRTLAGIVDLEVEFQGGW